ncbi:hypothetical protein ACFL96_16640 [Thermoproteota archaeon]
MRKKRAQVSLFIIIGIILLFTIFTILFFRTKQAEGETTVDIARITEEIPSELQPVKTFVEGCILATGIEALKLIGVHGGYIGLEPSDSVYTKSSFSTEPQTNKPTKYDALTVSPDWKIAYWWYMESPNKCNSDCQFSSGLPPLYRNQGDNAIELQVDRYIEMNIGKCLRNFDSFRRKGMDITNTSDIKVTTTVAENDVVFFVDFPLRIEWAEGVSTASQFITSADVNLRKMYKLAVEITETQANQHFLEGYTLHLIGAYSGLDENKLPPMAGTELDFRPKKWRMSDIENKLTGILTHYINVLQATRTRNFDVNAIFFPDDPIKTGLYRLSIIPLEEDWYPEFDVQFTYLGWPMYLYITSGGVVGPRDSISIPLISMFLPIQKYDVPYDVSYPVMVSLFDHAALKRKGYPFYFALESNVRNNQAFTTDSVQLTTVTMDSGMSTQLCEDIMMTSGNVTFRVMDKEGNYIERALVIFSEGDGSACFIGETDETGFFDGKFPRGGLGSLVIKHPDFATYSKTPFRAKKDPEVTDLGVIYMNKYIYKNATAKKIDLNKVDIHKGNIAHPCPKYKWKPDKFVNLAPTEHAVIILEREKETPFDDDVVAAFDSWGTNFSESRLIPGNYSARFMLIQENVTIIIPAMKECIRGSFCWPGVCLQAEDFDEEVYAKNSAYASGMFEIKVYITDAMYNSNYLEFKLPSFNIEEAHPQSHMDQEKMQDEVDDYVHDHKDQFRYPRYVPTS